MYNVIGVISNSLCHGCHVLAAMADCHSASLVYKADIVTVRSRVTWYKAEALDTLRYDAGGFPKGFRLISNISMGGMASIEGSRD